MNTRSFAVAIALTLSVLWMPHVASAAQPCEKLTSLKLPDTTITAASVVAAGPFVANPTAAAAGLGAAPPAVPAFCRVQLTVASARTGRATDNSNRTTREDSRRMAGVCGGKRTGGPWAGATGREV